MSREHLGPLPQRLLLAEHGERAARRPHPAGPAKTRLSRRLQAPEESERGADVLLHRVVSVRLYEDSALGLAAAHLGHFPVRGRESAVQDGAGHFGGVLGPPEIEEKVQRTVRNARFAEESARGGAVRGVFDFQHEPHGADREGLRSRTPKTNDENEEGTAREVKVVPLFAFFFCSHVLKVQSVKVVVEFRPKSEAFV